MAKNKIDNGILKGFARNQKNIQKQIKENKKSRSRNKNKTNKK